MVLLPGSASPCHAAATARSSWATGLTQPPSPSTTGHHRQSPLATAPLLLSVLLLCPETIAVLLGCSGPFVAVAVATAKDAVAARARLWLARYLAVFRVSSARVWGCEEMRDEEERSREGAKQRGLGTGVWKLRKKPPPLCVFFFFFSFSFILQLVLF